MSLVTIKNKKMKNQHRHYMIYFQLALLVGLTMLSLSGQGVLHIVAIAFPYITSIGLLWITARLFMSIMRMLIDPNLSPGRNNNIHGSSLPVMVYTPNI